MKKLEKVGEKEQSELLASINKNVSEKLKILNQAYGDKNGFAIDTASKDLLKYLEKELTKEHSAYIEMKNHTWQRNHMSILGSISDLMQKNNCMPSNTSIAIEAGLSDETVYKHLKEFKNHELYEHEKDKYQIMVHRVLTTVFNLGVQGNISACKMFLDFMGNSAIIQPLPLPPTNYIQINNLKITANELEQLPPTTLQKIENLIKLPSKQITKEKRTITG
jgi:uncharacterized membrane protein